MDRPIYPTFYCEECLTHFLQATISCFLSSHKVPTMVCLPYICDSYEDEILGSWIAGIALHNGKGAWTAALEYVGFRRGVQLTVFDCFQYSERLAKLLGLLGVTYEALILKLSLLPYQLAFDCLDPHEQRLPGTTRIPALAKRKSYHRAHIRNRGDDSRPLRWCPVCLDEDWERYRELYWHREHQLPNVFVCRRHQCLLHFKCPSCAFAQIAPMIGLVPLPVMKCGCGTDLRSAVELVSISPAYRRLLQVSYDALNSDIPDWTKSMVRKYLKQRLKDHYGSDKAAYSKILAAAFRTPVVIDQSLMHVDLQLKTGLLRFHRFFWSANAADCCGLLAAMDISFDEARVGFASQPRLACQRTPDSAAPDILFARQQMLASGGSLDRRGPGKRLYWTLRLFDLNWLKSHYPTMCRGHVPGVLRDRVDMLHILNDRSRTPLKLRALLSQRQSTIRASLRDFDWYSKQMNWLRTAVTAQRRASARALGVVGKNVVQQALERTLKEQKRPELITAVTLAPLASLSEDQVRSILRKNPDLKSEIQRLNEDRPRRLLLWAGREMQKANQPLSFTAICRKARGSHYYLKYCSLKAIVMEELEHSSYCKPESGTPPVISKPRKRRLLCDPQEVVRLRHAGCSFIDIGIRLSISDVTALRLFYQETGIQPQPQKMGCTPADVRHLRDIGWTFPQIENALGICHTTAIAYSQGWKPKSPCRIRDGGGISFKTVLSLYRGGLSLGDIASRLGTRKANIRRMLNAMYLLGVRLGDRYRGRSVKTCNVRKLVALRDAGLSFAKIAQKCRICGSRAYHLVRAYQELVLGRKVDINSTKRAQREKSKIMALRSEGRTMRAIARETGLSPKAIRRVIRIESGGRDWTPKLIDSSAVIELRRQGNSHGTIAQRLGLNRKTVAKIVNASDLEPCFKRPIVHSVPVDKSTILELRAQGLTYAAIAARTGISRKSVQNRERGKHPRQQ